MLEQLRQYWASLVESIRRIERESLLEQSERIEEGPYLHILGITILACIILTVLEFYGSSGDWSVVATAVGWFSEPARREVEAFFQDPTRGELYRLGYWSLATCTGYLVIPAIYVQCVMSDSLTDMGLSVRGTLEHTPLYVALYLLILPAIYVVSSTSSFQETYPFYSHAGRSIFDFLLWELFYGLQFLSLEFFFRGFLVHGLKSRFGFYSIFVSTIPYCMIHFGKPFPEAIGAIFAGITLGAFSILTGNIWLGVLIHVSVAISMDVFAMFEVFDRVNQIVSGWMLQL